MEVHRGITSFNTLPRAGGLFDQDAKLMYFLLKVDEYIKIRQEMDQKKQQSGGTGGPIHA